MDSASEADTRRKRLRFRSWHRGLRELDLVFGRFADASIGDLTPAELDQYEQLLDLPDIELLAWITGVKVMPAEHRSPLFDRIMAFGRAMTF